LQPGGCLLGDCLAKHAHLPGFKEKAMMKNKKLKKKLKYFQDVVDAQSGRIDGLSLWIALCGERIEKLEKAKRLTHLQPDPFRQPEFRAEQE
jgi:hypothetical protein